MTRESDSSSSSYISLSKQETKSKKLHKKYKEKSEKKHKKEKKKHKEKKRTRKEMRNTFSDKADTQIHSPIASLSNNTGDTDAFGPALPPHLLNKNKNETSVIGPKIPVELLGSLEKSESKSLTERDISKSENEDNDFQGSYGPLPTTNELEMTPAQLKLEQRALELKMAAIDGATTSINTKKEREEWMLELPDVGLKGGLAGLTNLKRGFHQGKEKPDFSDRSSWTKTPNSGQERPKLANVKEEQELRAKELYEKMRDAEQETIAKKHNKKHKRDKSLVEIHQKKMRKEEKKKARELKESNLKPERRPFTRDVDLKLNKIDRNQTKQIVDKAKILNTKFSAGHSKYL